MDNNEDFAKKLDQLNNTCPRKAEYTALFKLFPILSPLMVVMHLMDL
jgi:hypothetical protein